MAIYGFNTRIPFARKKLRLLHLIFNNICTFCCFVQRHNCTLTNTMMLVYEHVITHKHTHTHTITHTYSYIVKLILFDTQVFSYFRLLYLFNDAFLQFNIIKHISLYALLNTNTIIKRIYSFRCI